MQKKRNIQMKRVATVTIEETEHQTYTDADLRKFLNLPKDAKIWVQIPGGGDYSGMQLALSKETPLQISFRIK
jgi:hypothetical protein